MSLLSRALVSNSCRWQVFGLATSSIASAYRAGRTSRPQGGVLVVSNHQSHFDPPLVGLGCPRRMNYVARADAVPLRPVPLADQLASDAIPIDREGIGLGRHQGVAPAAEAGRDGADLPRGHPHPRRRDCAPFRPGFTTLAVRSSAAILPVAIEGAFQAWPRWHKLPGWAASASITASRSRPPKSPAATSANLLAEVERRIRECHARLKRDRVG